MKLECKFSSDGWHRFTMISKLRSSEKWYVARCLACGEHLDSKASERLLNIAVRRHPNRVALEETIVEAIRMMGDRPEESARILALAIGIALPDVDLDALRQMDASDFGALREGQFGETAKA